MIIRKEVEIEAAIQEVWNKITDIDDLVKSLPSVEKVEPAGENQRQIVSRIDVGLISIVFDINFRVTKLLPPIHFEAQSDARARKRLGQVSQTHTVDLVKVSESRTQVKYESQVALKGLVKILGQTILSQKMEKVANEFSEAFINTLKKISSPQETL